MVYWDSNWWIQGGSSHMIEISKRWQFYQQEYCGCVYSLRDRNLHRKSQGRPLISSGKLYYGKEDDLA
jgi:predicted adenine nucleotide alpha hydrolase (AANH) superfamily ATPase